jgi:hypothetical protein
MKPTVPMEVHSMAPVVVYAGFFWGGQHSPFRVQVN